MYALSFILRLWAFRFITWAGKSIVLSVYTRMRSFMGAECADLCGFEPDNVVEFVETWADGVEFTLRGEMPWNVYKYSARKYLLCIVHDLVVYWALEYDVRYDFNATHPVWKLTDLLDRWADIRSV